MKRAVIGSRAYNSQGLANVARHVQSLPEDTILVSGGARGVDQVAEAAHKGRVFSFRIYEGENQYGVEFWDYGGKNPRMVRFDEFFADAKSALKYRDWLIAHECDELDAFWNGWSKGTETTATMAKDLGKKVTYL